jgi:hypothetical protein
VRNLTKIFAGAILTLSSSVIAYVPDRCDWDDCGAESDGGGLGLLILFAIVLFIIAKSK